jgi:hypothetical protein
MALEALEEIRNSRQSKYSRPNLAADSSVAFATSRRLRERLYFAIASEIQRDIAFVSNASIGDARHRSRFFRNSFDNGNPTVRFV